MSLAPGTRLGPYEILTPLGSGGMGEVYRARDTRLDRTVAIKVLSAEVSSRPEVRARFDREARAVSSLAHPHICTLFDVGHEDGVDYLVMEHLDGESLARRLERGPLPAGELLRHATDIADALDAAHRQGVVHRDLKPGNVMLTRAGAKLLDFGLARVGAPAAGVSGLSESPTVSQPLTGEGTIVGTLQYMAPEQLEGHEADARTDIFAFGAVLYEMATGKKAFEAKSRASLIAAIMERDPPPISSLAPLAPPALDRIVKRCLAKDPEQRWQTARDLKHELEWVREDSSGTRAVAEAPAGARPERPARRGGWGAVRMAAIAIGVVGAVALAYRVFQPGVPRLNPAMTVRPLEVPFPLINYPGMSQDGKWIALPAADERGRWGLYFMNVNGGEPREIVSDSALIPRYADISPDGSQIAYNAASATGLQIRIVPALGGLSRMIADPGQLPRWRPDGERIGYLVSGRFSRSGKLELWTVMPDGSDRRLEYVDTLYTGANRLCFAWSPDAKRIAWLRGFKDASCMELIVRTLATGRERQLTHDRCGIDEVCWTRPNELVFSSNRGGHTNLWMISASGGRPVQVTKDLGPDIGMRLSADGQTLLCLQQQPIRHVWIADLERGVSQQVTRDDLAFSSVSFSPDRRRIAAILHDPDVLRQTGEIMVMDRDGRNRRPITLGDVTPFAAQWAPATNQIAFCAAAHGSLRDSAWIYLVNPDDPTSIRKLVPGMDVMWASDSTLLAFHFKYGGVVSARDGSELSRGPDSMFCIPFANGTALEVDSRGGRSGVWLQRRGAHPGDPASRRYLLPLATVVSGTRPAGDWLLYLDSSGALMRLRIPTGSRERVHGTFNGMTLGSSGELSPDGRELVYLEPGVSSRLLLYEHLR